MADRIPKVIHQAFRSTTMPEPLRHNVEYLKAQNPGWEHRLYDDAAITRFIAVNYDARTLAAYERISPEYGAARVDFFRYLLIYREGGVYLDIKSTFTRPLDEVIKGDEGLILSQWRNGPGQTHQDFGLLPDIAHIPGGEFQQWHVIAAPGHPFLRAVIDRVMLNIETYRPWKMGVGKIGVVRTTGPVAYTLAIHPLLQLHPCKIIANEREISMEYSIGDGYVHNEIFKRHYSTLDTPVASLPLHLRPLVPVFQRVKRLRDRLRSSAGAKKVIG